MQIVHPGLLTRSQTNTFTVNQSRINLSSNTTEYKADTDDMVKDVNNIFYEADNLSLKQKPLRKSTSKPKQNVKKKPR